MILYIIQGGIDMTDELQGIVNRIAATNYTNKKSALFYVTEHRTGLYKRKGYFREAPPRQCTPGRLYARGLQNAIIIA